MTLKIGDKEVKRLYVGNQRFNKSDYGKQCNTTATNHFFFDESTGERLRPEESDNLTIIDNIYYDDDTCIYLVEGKVANDTGYRGIYYFTVSAQYVKIGGVLRRLANTLSTNGLAMLAPRKVVA
ncbi:hypothetical protein [Lactobacillus sp.]|uniref:hypothetical protein n=1 Tax=Lactobacillus sp. TaxID=1591 RepID=UPI00199C4692|nr:hypothetical protein [Lactobacillus sp.]MBD5429720.1 hypothetical protein [Lactobacillus sp.]